MQLKVVKDDIVKAGDGQTAKEYFGQLGTCLVGAQSLVNICL